MPELFNCYLCGAKRPPEEMLAVAGPVEGNRIDFSDPDTFEADFFCLGSCERIARNPETGFHKRLIQQQDQRAEEKRKRLKEKKKR